MVFMNGCFYFISNNFYDEFPNEGLMLNKEGKQGELHDRPCFFAFPDKEYPFLLWLIPISSQIKKYEEIYSKKVEKYGYCNTIYFCDFIGQKKAFLIQNMFPATLEYISDTYINRDTLSEIRIRSSDEKKIVSQANKLMKAHNVGKNVFFTNIDLIKQTLLEKQSKN